MTYLAKGVFRVVGQLHPGFLSVEYVRHCDDSPRPTFPKDAKVIFDEPWVGLDRIPIDQVAVPDRFPNTLLRVTVKSTNHEIIHVERHTTA
jgi:hypothetical protein